MRWGTYRRAVRVGKIDDSQAHARGKEVGVEVVIDLYSTGELTEASGNNSSFTTIPSVVKF